MVVRFYKPKTPLVTESESRNFLENYQKNKGRYWEDCYEWVDHPEIADFFFLPGTWNYYFDNQKTEKVSDYLGFAQENHKKTIIFSGGDYTANIPFKNCVIIQSSAFKSRDGLNDNNMLSMPTFIDDYLQVHFQGSLRLREYTDVPVIGFCGQSAGSWLDYTRRDLNLMLANTRYKAGMIRWEPPSLEPTRFRNNILQQIARSEDVQTNFIMRKKYRAGYRPRTKDPLHPTRVEFVKNIISSDYTVCVRGGGNFSARFYETLALGRIPIFINTDCILPLDDIINYKEYMVWVEEDELPVLTQKILDFHSSLNQDKFVDLQVACRKLWEDYLTKDGYYMHLADQLKKLANVVE